MELVIASCLVLITIALWGAAIAVVLAAVQLRRTAQAIEIKVYEAGDQIGRLGELTSAAGRLAGVFNSPWVKGLGLALGAATTYYTVRTRRKSAAGAASNGRGES